jgi:hypothetical protein
MSNAYKTKLEVKRPKNIAMVFNHNKRGIMPKKTERRRGIYSNQPKEKVKPTAIKRIEKQDVSEILKQGRLKNKEEMEELLSIHGGNYKADFGLRDTVDFDDGTGNGWNRFFSYIQGNIQDQRIGQTIIEMNNTNSNNPSFKTPLSPIRTPNRKPESITELTKMFTSNAQKMTGKKKPKSIKMIQNFRQKRNKKTKLKRNQLNFKTPPPKMNYTTIDPNCQTGYNEQSFQNFSEEPEFRAPQKQNLNILKASISKLSVDFAQDRQFLANVKRKANRNQFSQVGGSPFIKSADQFSFDQNENKLPSINQSVSKRGGAIKSPVMESIRMSRNTKAATLMSLQRFKPSSTALYDDGVSDDGKSEISGRSNIRASYVSR